MYIKNLMSKGKFSSEKPCKEDILKWVVQIYPKMNVNNFKQIARMGASDFSDTFLEGDEETTYQKGKMFGKPINPKDTEDMQYKTMLKIRGRTSR